MPRTPDDREQGVPPAGEPAAVAAALAADSSFGTMRACRTLPGRAPDVREMPDWVDPALAQALRRSGIDRLWSHQSAAASLAHAGGHVVLATGTASGKSLGYLLPGLTAVADGTRAPNGRGATMLYLAPTKALAADQAAAIERLAVPGVRAATYDGDTAPEERRWIRDHANVVLSNPDLLHHSLLPGHPQWASFLRALRVVVLDECHAYYGIFGSNVALVVRRLRRVLERYRADPVFVLASATVSDAGAHASELTGLPVQEISTDGSPRGPVTFALWEPPTYADRSGRERRLSASTTTARLLAELVGTGVQTLAFARSRAGVESVASAANQALAGADRTERVSAYRGGYLPEERRDLERQLRSGTLRGLAATNALELGIDVSGLDAVLMAGWPGRLSSVWQQAGRAGRGGGPSLAILVGADDPLDAYVLDHPDVVFDAPVERTIIFPTNARLLPRQLVAAAYERPITEADATHFGPALLPTLDQLVTAGLLRRRPTGWFWPSDSRPADIGSLRSGAEVVAIVEGASGRVIGTVDASSAQHQVHAGAVHVHQGVTYVVTDLDLESATATAVRGDPGWSTFARSTSAFELGSPMSTRRTGPVTVHFGEVRVRSRVVSFVRRLPGGEVLGEHPLDLPEQVLRTQGVWWTMAGPDLAAAGIRDDTLPGAAHAAEHAAIGMLPLFASCDRWDIGGVSTPMHPQTGQPTILVYDGYPGGAGYAARGHEVLPAWLGATLAAVTECPCAAGCPRCIQSPKCGSGNNPLDKAGAVTLLRLVTSALARE